jgi:hypothetical protein
MKVHTKRDLHVHGHRDTMVFALQQEEMVVVRTNSLEDTAELSLVIPVDSETCELRM